MIRSSARALALALFVMICGGAEPETKPAESPTPAPAAASASPPPWTGAWVSAMGTLAKETWGTNGIGELTLAPGTGAILASVDGIGVLATSDGGVTWMRLGAQEKSLVTRPGRILVDPEHPATWWISGGGDPGIFATSDAGATIKHLGALAEVRGFDVDWSDPKRELMLACVQAKERGLRKSTHGGTAWSKAGAKLPDSAPLDQVVIIDAKTWLVATAQAAKEGDAGILRTDDAGGTWRKVYSKGVKGPPVRGPSSLIWCSADGSGLVATLDKGRTWASMTASPRGIPIAIPGGWIAALGDTRLLVSRDLGRSWSAVGPDLPGNADRVAYSPTTHAFFACRLGGTAAGDAIVRLDVPEDLAAVARAPITRTVVVWDGDALVDSSGFTSPKEPPNQIATQQEVARVGRGAALARMKNANWTHFGWNWDKTKAPKLDAGTCKRLVFALKVDGDKKPESATVAIGARWVSLQPYCADAFDGAWHDVVIPVRDLDDGKLDLAAVEGLQMRFAAGGDIDISVYIDEIGFTGE